MKIYKHEDLQINNTKLMYRDMLTIINKHKIVTSD